MAKARKLAAKQSRIEPWHGCLVDACTGRVWRAATRREAQVFRRRRSPAVLVVDGRACVLHGAVVAPGQPVKKCAAGKPAKKRAKKKRAKKKRAKKKSKKKRAKKKRAKKG